MWHKFSKKIKGFFVFIFLNKRLEYISPIFNIRNYISTFLHESVQSKWWCSWSVQVALSQFQPDTSAKVVCKKFQYYLFLVLNQLMALDIGSLSNIKTFLPFFLSHKTYQSCSIRITKVFNLFHIISWNKKYEDKPNNRRIYFCCVQILNINDSVHGKSI